jgi:F-box protein 9
MTNQRSKEKHPNLPTISEAEPASSSASSTPDEAGVVPSLKTAADDLATDDDSEKVSEKEGDGSAELEPSSLSPLWSGANEGWELTWPIWHMLPRDERKTIAQRHGYKSIGEFEEYMSLQQAVGDSEFKASSVQKGYPNESIYFPGAAVTTKAGGEPSLQLSSSMEKTAQVVLRDKEDDDDDNSSDDDEKAFYGRQSSTNADDDMPIEELMSLGGKLLILHDEILHKIFSWLPVDAYGTLALVSPHWKHLTRTESVYKRLCERLYLNQSKRRQLHVSRFGGSYRRMLEVRPRVRAAGGCYVLKYSQVKKIQRDMWTEVPVGAILESVYYR